MRSQPEHRCRHHVDGYNRSRRTIDTHTTHTAQHCVSLRLRGKFKAAPSIEPRGVSHYPEEVTPNPPKHRTAEQRCRRKNPSNELAQSLVRSSSSAAGNSATCRKGANSSKKPNINTTHRSHRFSPENPSPEPGRDCRISCWLLHHRSNDPS